MDAKITPIPAATAAPPYLPAPVPPPAPDAPAERDTEPTPAPPARPEPLRLAAQLRIEVDAEAGRFVQRFFNPANGELVRQFPAEAQLAYSRATAAYLRARAERDA